MNKEDMADNTQQEAAYQELYNDMCDGDDHTVLLKQSINLNDLCGTEGKGSEFEVDDVAPVGDLPKYADEDVYKYSSAQAIGIIDEEEENNVNEESEDGPFEILARRMNDIVKDGGVKKKILNEGIGGQVPEKVQVIVHYNGYLEYSDEPYDSTRLRKSPLKYVLGCGEMIPGLELGISTMRKGEEAQFLIQPEYAFGKKGCPPRVPANATVLFDVELTNWVECTELHEFFSMPMEERRSCDYKLLKKVAHHFLEEGKEKFKQEKYYPAAMKYMKAVDAMKAIRALEPFHPKDEAEENQWRKHLIRAYQNIAVCNLKQCNLGKTISFSNEALTLDPNSVKAMYYKGKALRKLGEFKRAETQLLKARKLEPKNKDINNELQELECSMQKFAFAEKHMCQKMFAPAGASNKENTAKSANRSKSSNKSSEASVSEEFKKNVDERLQSFKDDSSLMELPLPRLNYTLEELDYIEEVAERLELDHTEHLSETNAHIRLCKRTPVGTF